MIPLDPHRRKYRDKTRKRTHAVDWKDSRLGDVMASGPDEPPMTACGGNFIGGEIRRNEQCPLCGLATIEPAERRRHPGCKASGESKKNPEAEKLALPPQDFSCFLGPEAHQLFVTPAKLAEAVFFSQLAISPKWVQGPWPLVQVHEGRRGPRSVVPFVVFLPFIKRLLAV